MSYEVRGHLDVDLLPLSADCPRKHAAAVDLEAVPALLGEAVEAASESVLVSDLELRWTWV